MQYSFCLFLISLFLFSGNGRAEDFRPSEHPEYYFHGGKPPVWGYQSVRERVFDSVLGFREQPGVVIHDIMRTRESVIWDVNLTIQADGTRFVPQQNGERRYFLATFGCSYVLGTGLNDDETLPFFLSKELSSFRSYNLGIGSAGTNMLLALVGETDLRKVLKEPKGLFLYIPIWGHVGRANGFFEESQWMGETPYYEKNSAGVLERVGTLNSARPIRTFLYSGLRKIKKWIAPNWRINWPPLKSAHYQYTCDLIRESAKKFEKNFPGSKFIVVNHPLGPMVPEVMDCIRTNKIRAIDFMMDRKENYFIPVDGHPSKNFNQDFALKIREEIQELLKQEGISREF